MAKRSSGSAAACTCFPVRSRSPTCSAATPGIVYSMRGELEKAAPLIGVAIIIDMLDGRVARMTGTTSAFGVEFDSLADIISFGVAPAILAFQWGLQPLGRLGWAAGFVFVARRRDSPCPIQYSGRHGGQAVLRRVAEPGTAGVPASTIFFHPMGFESRQRRYRCSRW